jgi:hypothetical protein
MSRDPGFLRRVAAGIADAPEERPPCVASVSDIGELQSQARIRAAGCSSVGLRHKRALRRLWIEDANDEWLGEIAELEQLEMLIINGTSSGDLTVLSRLAGLRRLLIRNAPQLDSMEFASPLQGLEALGLTDVPGIRSLSPVSGLTQLTAFALEISPRGADTGIDAGVETLQPLAALSALEYLYLVSLKVDDESLEPLLALKSLKVLECGAFFPAVELRKLHLANPQLACQWFSVMDTPLYRELYQGKSAKQTRQ